MGGDLSADELNAAIRELWARSGGRLSPEQRMEYTRLVVAWAAASGRDEVAEAA
ncbi:hypothetical protein ACIRD2_02930 [Streptomyces sp. NPDC093595]|uniref:hypothetical protein n=1 Tax=Streptomyces sp. NPDC093595 TaxID=3366045 RepID=UPI00380709E3